MKIHFLAFALLGSSFSPFTMAQAPDDLSAALEKLPESGAATQPDSSPRVFPKSLRIQLEYIELSHEALTRLLFLAEPKTSDARPLREKLQEMVEKGEANVLETQIAVGESGGKFTSESISEVIYPTEYEPPTLACEYPAKDSSRYTTSLTPMVPTAFDTRNTGSTLEVEPLLSEDGNTIQLKMVPELVWHTGNTTWLEYKDGLENIYKMDMPDFHALRLNTSVTCLNGQYTLVAALSPKNDKGDVDMTRKVVMLLKCDVLAVK
jgi:hypothetical protein